MNKEELIKNAKAYFVGNTREKILATPDGQFFWEEHKHYAAGHVGGKTELISVITREETETVKEVKVKPIEAEIETVTTEKEEVKTETLPVVKKEKKVRTKKNK